MSFASLPYELRSHIWSLAVEPRRIHGVRMERCFTVNFEVDIFCVTSLYCIADISESVNHFGVLNVLDDFISLREIKIILEPGDLRWGTSILGHNLERCPNITFVDEHSGLALTGPQLRLAEEWRIRLSFDIAGYPPDPDRLSEEIAHARLGFWRMSMAEMYEIG
ncbi:uncharacterized protein F5Z01DRAFT_681325 [Emericellopsis atlantica]|uniref:Uncharacterized protein n=1 Tax=Emericellopsis atlantica TaxID=2614577 RepID=A0A9P7ZN90_9HYPO|nr:uncharacterized protein F5Z01DRAFT_681325 [Emericellopsis atlantica]KAG9254812.1 hypothetical protein F5Z01DRAFT_681325 [Emericellopsis atlantica]